MESSEILSCKRCFFVQGIFACIQDELMQAVQRCLAKKHVCRVVEQATD